jgi:hypothetical protein
MGDAPSIVKTITRAVNNEPACLNGLGCMFPPEKKDGIGGSVETSLLNPR